MADTTFVSKVTSIPRAWLQDINDAYYRAKDFSTSGVTTRSVQSSAGLNLRLNAGSGGVVLVQLNGATCYLFDATQFIPQQGDNTQNIGAPTLRWAKIFTPIIDSGTTGIVALKVNNGETVLNLVRGPGVVGNHINIRGNITGGSPIIYSEGDLNTALTFGASGNSSINFITNRDITDSTQFQVLHTAAATSNATITGAAAAGTIGATLNVTGGRSLAITPSVVFGGVITVTGVGNPAASGSVRTAYGTGNPALTSRNNANSTDMTLIASDTRNSVVDLVMLGLTATNGVQLKGRSGAGVPTGSDIAPGEWGLWRDTSGATTKLYYNNAGTIQSVALA